MRHTCCITTTTTLSLSPLYSTPPIPCPSTSHTWLLQLLNVSLQLPLTAAGPHDLPEQRPVIGGHSSLGTRQAEEQLLGGCMGEGVQEVWQRVSSSE